MSSQSDSKHANCIPASSFSLNRKPWAWLKYSPETQNQVKRIPWCHWGKRTWWARVDVMNIVSRTRLSDQQNITSVTRRREMYSKRVYFSCSHHLRRYPSMPSFFLKWDTTYSSSNPAGSVRGNRHNGISEVIEKASFPDIIPGKENKTGSNNTDKIRIWNTESERIELFIEKLSNAFRRRQW